ncbi:MAG TPA: pantoate--beta-alanine ligase [Marmoricola sp.]|nr:pantoate--beta-alanine ligase [Marmoricola sp.]
MNAPLLVRTRADLQQALTRPGGGARDEGPQVGFVATMGALHEGHAALMRRARTEVGPEGRLVVSVFVNPLQFGAGEDLDRYPRTLDADLELCAAEGVDAVFAPGAAEVYPDGDPRVTVDPGPLGTVLEGEFRPTHFRGVLTVVAKLLGLVRPDVTVFGEKDYQQLVLVRRMAADLCQGVRVVGAATVREPDGLALSSRNRYLDAEQREQALVLSRALRAGQADAARGAESALGAARAELRRVHGVDLDYLVVTDPHLGPAPTAGDARMLVAARLGSTRLIDNVPLHLGPAAEEARR